MSENSESDKSDVKRLEALFFIVILLFGFSIWVLYCIFPDLTDRGAFGDSFGVVNSLFSGLAFAGLIFTIYLQRTELKLQREELQATRVELKRSAKAQEKSEEQLRQQAENMKLTAKLNGLNTLSEYYNSKVPKNGQLDRVQIEYRKRLEEIANEIEEIIKSI